MNHATGHATATMKSSSSGQHATMTSIDMEACITGCLACHAVCLQTVEHCLEVGGAHAAQRHIRLLLDCAELREASAHFMMRRSPFEGRVCALCAEACRACEDACRRMGGVADVHCAESCHRCAEMVTHVARESGAAA